jgi:hypothetical protein
VPEVHKDDALGLVRLGGQVLLVDAPAQRHGRRLVEQAQAVEAGPPCTRRPWRGAARRCSTRARRRRSR